MTSYILPDDLPNDSFAIDLVSCHNFSLSLRWNSSDDTELYSK